MEGVHFLLLVSIIAVCILPTFQQGWTGNNAMQPAWQAQPVAAAPVTGQAQQPQQTWNQPQQQPAQQWGAQPTTQTGGTAQQSWSSQQTQGVQAQQPPQQPSNKGSGVGVRMLSIRAGDGKTFPSMGQNVTVHYTGKLYSNGQQFDSSVERGTPFTFTLGVGQVIRGWDIAVAHDKYNIDVLTLTLGQKARFTVGPEYAYGTEGIPGTIPPNAVLVFDVELLSIQ